ncbi:MAG: sugar ABC transporter ATP-binding protein [Spirochaetes bacterium]|nr:MAG: sugar ABC transporter ATP-binding protein [Spirochaetota bacterium]
MAEYIVQMVDIHKWFGKVYALRGVDFNVGFNEIVGLVGDNGAGKSTLIKILSGYHIADRGEIYFNGEKVNIQTPKDAKKLGIETVYQEQALAPHVSISRNVFMGREPSKFLGFIDKKKMDNDSLNVLTDLGLKIKDPNLVVETLSGGQRQGVAIARVLYFKAKLVILDEPTIALSVKESQQVMEFMKQLRSEGISVIFITHNIYHAFQISDRFVILSHGEKLADVRKEETSLDELISLITSGKSKSEV